MPGLNDPADVAREYASERGLLARRSLYDQLDGEDVKAMLFETVVRLSRPRVLEVGPGTGELAQRLRRRDCAITGPSKGIAWIRGADTFFIGTAHPTRGADASHRGGPSGFVRVHDGELWWPDYTGNNMFNTRGTIAIDPSAALLFPDFSTGRTVQLSGMARVEWTAPGAAGDDDTAGRLVRFTSDQVISGRSLGARAETTVPYDDNPRLSGDPIPPANHTSKKDDDD